MAMLLTLIAAACVSAPPMDLGVVMNIDLGSEAVFKSHFDVATGWASFIRVSTGMDQEGWKPDIAKLPLTRAKRLAQECAKRGWGMHVVLGGVPEPTMWSEALEPAPANYRRDRYGTMPRSWWPKWVEYQRAVARATVAAYGPGATSKIRFQLMNEPYARGEDDVVDELIAYLVPRITDRRGLVEGCPLDGPSLWGYPHELSPMMLRFRRLLDRYPDIDRAIQRVPFSAYPMSDGRPDLNPAQVTEDFAAHCESLVRRGTALFKRPIYFCEFGVGVAYDMPVSIFGARANELAERSMIEVLDRLRRKGITTVTIYQTRDTHEKEEREKGYGLLDRFGRPRFNTSNLVRLARGEDVIFQ